MVDLTWCDSAIDSGLPPQGFMGPNAHHSRYVEEVYSPVVLPADMGEKLRNNLP